MEPGADTEIAFIGYHHVLVMILASSWVLTGLTFALKFARTMFKLTASSFTSWGLYCEYWGHEQHLRSGSQVRRIHNEFDGRGQHRSQRSEDQGWILRIVRTKNQPKRMGLCQWSIRPAFSRYSRARVQTLRTSYTPASISRTTSSSPACCKCATPVDAVCMTFADRVAGSAPWL
jgi:hypothetical protein